MYKSKYPSLIEFLTNQEDLILLDSEIQNIENLVDKDLKAINYTRCCKELKDKEVLSFNEWLSHFKKENDFYWLNKETLYCKDAMKLHYDNLPDV